MTQLGESKKTMEDFSRETDGRLPKVGNILLRNVIGPRRKED